MKMLSAFTVNGTPVEVPSSLQNIQRNPGPLGENILKLGVEILLIAIIVFALFSIIWSAIQWITSEGDKQKLQNARLRLTYSIVGLLIAFLALLVISLIGQFLNIKLLG